jgi:undecaprenyl-diphosphatase
MEKEKTNIFSNLRTIGLLGRKPLIGLVLFIIGSLFFAILAYNVVMKGPLTQWDVPIAESFHALALNSSPAIINIMIAGYYLGIQGIAIIGLLFGLYFLYKRFWRELVMVAIGLGLSGIMFYILTGIFKRPRPSLLFDKLIWAASPTNPGFPSGHTITIVACFGFLTYLLVPKMNSYMGKAMVIIISLLIMLYIGFSRLYIGDHYLVENEKTMV